MDSKFVLTVFVFAAVLAGSASAQYVELTDLTVEPSTMWMHKASSLKVTGKCRYNNSYQSNAIVTAKIMEFNTEYVSLEYNPNYGRYENSLNYYFSSPGTYTIKFACEYDGKKTEGVKQFTVRKLTLESTDKDDQIEAYRGGVLTLKVAFKVDNQLVYPSQDTFTVYVNGERVDLEDTPVITDTYQKIRVEIPLDDDDVDEGVHDLEVKATYMGESIRLVQEDFVKINAPLNLRLSQEEITCPANMLCEATISAEVLFYDGDLSDLEPEANFEAVVIGQGRQDVLYVKDVACTESTSICELKLDVPSNLNPGDYELFLSVAYPSLGSYDYLSQDSMALRIVVRMEGYIKNPKGDVVETTITFINTKTGKTTTTSATGMGDYSLDLLPGTYDVELKFATGTIGKFYNVNITRENMGMLASNLIRYDKGGVIEGKLAGVKTIGSEVIEFALPYNRAWVYLPYDSSLVSGDEQDLEIYRCSSWNFKKSSCTGTWEHLDSSVHTIRDVIEFQTEASGSFIIAEKTSLFFRSVEIVDKDYYLGEPVEVTGTITNNEGNYVSGVTVKAFFPGYEGAGEVVTGGNGAFSITLNAPQQTGRINLVLTAEKSPATPANASTSIRTVRKKELSIVEVPDIVSAYVGQKTPLKITFFNSGQVNFTEPLYLRITGIQQGWFTLSPAKLNNLLVDERKTFNFDVAIDEADCKSGCDEFYLVTAEANTEDYTQAISFSLKLIMPQNTTSGEGGGGLSLGGITGMASSLPSVGRIRNIGYTPFFLTIIILLALIASKRGGSPPKKGGGRGASQPSRREGLRSLRSEGRNQGDVRNRKIALLYRVKKDIEGER